MEVSRDFIKETFSNTIRGSWSKPSEHYGIQWDFDKVNDTYYVKFRGTGSELKSWATNFNFFQKKVKFYEKGELIKVHRGFLKAWSEVKDEIISKLGKNPEKIIVSGFSQGGALATLAYKDFKYRFPKANIQAFTFASPRVFGIVSAFKLKKTFSELIRVYVNGDLVTHLPFLLMGFGHVGQRYSLGRKVFDLLPFIPIYWLIVRTILHHPDVYKKYLK